MKEGRKMKTLIILILTMTLSALMSNTALTQSKLDKPFEKSFKSTKTKSGEKIAFLVGGGIGFHITVNEPDPYSQERYKTGFALSLGIIPYSDGYHAIRFSLGCMKFTREDQTYSSLSYGHELDTLLSTTKRTGGDRNRYAVGLDIIAGYLKQKSTFNAYGFWSLGGGIYENSEIQDFTTISNKITSNSYTSTKKSESLIFADMGLGGGISLKISNKFRVYTELQYNFWSFGWSIGEGEVTTKTGIMFAPF